jgi:hypothetical protein
MCSCQRTFPELPARGLSAPNRRFQANDVKKWLAAPQRLRAKQPAFALASRSARRLVGVTGVEPVTLRLSSACSNQLSYTPRLRARALRRGKPAGLPENRCRPVFSPRLAEP